MPKKEETNDIIHYLIPSLNEIGIEQDKVKIDVTTENSGNKRGDIWISKEPQKSNDFEKNIIALIEAKHRKAVVGDIDWRDAMAQGKIKAQKQGLNYYIVTNCNSDVRFYNSYNDEEIALDGSVITQIKPPEILAKIQTQVRTDNSFVIDRASFETKPVSEDGFRKTLTYLADIYRSAGLKKGDERIDPTVGFVVLKYISEKEDEKRTLSSAIRLWDDFKKYVEDEEVGDLKAEFSTTIKQIWGENSDYKNNNYRDFKNLIHFPHKLKDNHYKKIYTELNKYHFHGANFDLFGAIYEEFASQTKKKEFGEFYTRRHITGIICRLLLRNEVNPRHLDICDPACGSGGFLTEAYKTLTTNYSKRNKLTNKILNQLQTSTFWGYDNDEKSVARTKLNMFLVGDGHIHIYQNDSLIDWSKKIKWDKNCFDYIMANPPMGKYDGDAKINNFDFTNESRFEQLFTEKIINATKYGGEIALVLNDGTLEAPSREDFRLKLLKRCTIYAIISLTKYAFAPYTKEKTYVLFMQKKQKKNIGTIQNEPIWSYILDYDGYANSDKRYRTKYHDDLPELEKHFNGALDTARSYNESKKKFKRARNKFERKVNSREEQEDLWGRKFGFITMDEVSSENFHNLLAEFYLRPYEAKTIQLDKFNQEYQNILNDLRLNF